MRWFRPVRPLPAQFYSTPKSAAVEGMSGTDSTAIRVDFRQVLATVQYLCIWIGFPMPFSLPHLKANMVLRKMYLTDQVWKSVSSV